jgi:hypothetical protein
MKGRANYLCRHKLVTLRDQPILSGLEEIDQYRQISEWEQTTETGDRAELSGMPESSPLWNKLDARTEACLGSTCPDYRRCFITEMRRKALESDIIIVNHHLFFADLSVKQEAAGAPDAGILPEAAAVIFDEAHELEEVASNYFGLSVSNIRFEELARDTDALLRGKEGADKLPAVTQQLRERARMFFAGLPMAGDGRQPFDGREEFLETSGDLYISVRAILRRWKPRWKASKASTKRPACASASPASAPSLSSCSNPTPATWSIGWSAASLAAAVHRRKSLPRTPRQAVPHHIPPSHAHRRLRAAARNGLRPSPPSCSPRPRSPCRAALSTCASASASPKPASWSSPLTSNTTSRPCSICRPTCPTRASPTSPKPPPSASAACSAHPRPRLLPLHQLRQMRDLYERLLPVLDFPCCCTAPPRARPCSSSSAKPPTPSSSAPQLLAGRRRAGRSAQLRHHRPSCPSPSPATRSSGPHARH